jgi:lipid-binding SYLF domain-containing protein
MKGLKNANRGALAAGLAAGISIALMLLLVIASPARSAGQTDAEALVNEARYVAERMLQDKDLPEFAAYAKEAKAVLIIPDLIKGGLIVGAKGGSGVLLARGPDGTWSAPSFVSIAGGSLGLQIGAQVSETIFTVMSESAVAALLEDEVTLGAEVSVAVGPIGKGLGGAAASNLRSDIYAFSKAAGLFGGGTLEGSLLLQRKSLNRSYYGSEAKPAAVLIERRFDNPQSYELRRVLP